MLGGGETELAAEPAQFGQLHLIETGHRGDHALDMPGKEFGNARGARCGERRDPCAAVAWIPVAPHQPITFEVVEYRREIACADEQLGRQNAVPHGSEVRERLEHAKLRCRDAELRLKRRKHSGVYRRCRAHQFDVGVQCPGLGLGSGIVSRHYFDVCCCDVVYFDIETSTVLAPRATPSPGLGSDRAGTRVCHIPQMTPDERDPAALQASGFQTPRPTARDAQLPMEYERKWLLTALPPRVRELVPETLLQGYLPGELLVERIRSVTTGDATTWIRTVKLGKGVARVEIEETTSADLGTALFALTAGRRVAKQRYAVSEGELTWEIDDFTDRELVLAEVELPDEHTPVTLPAWLAPWVVREVTEETEFTNWKLAR